MTLKILSYAIALILGVVLAAALAIVGVIRSASFLLPIAAVLVCNWYLLKWLDKRKTTREDDALKKIRKQEVLRLQAERDK